MPPICGTFFHANLAEVAVSAQVRPRTKLAGAKWIIAVEVYVKAEPCGEDRSFQRTHGTSFWESGCPQPHSPSTKEHLLWGLLPAFSPPFSACFLFLQVPQPLHAHSPPRCLPFPSLSSSWSEGLCTIQTKHHQPPPDSHQRVRFCVAFPPLIKNMTLSYLPLSPSTTQLYFG